MSTLRLSHLKKTTRDMNIPLRLKIQAKKCNRSLRGMSIALGKSQSFLSAKSKKHDFTATELLALSMYLDANLFEWFTDQLPATIRSTKRERELLQQIEEMEKQLLQLIEERNWLKEVVGRK